MFLLKKKKQIKVHDKIIIKNTDRRNFENNLIRK